MALDTSYVKSDRAVHGSLRESIEMQRELLVRYTRELASIHYELERIALLKSR